MTLNCPKCGSPLQVLEEKKMGVEKVGITKTTAQCNNRKQCGIFKTILFDNSEMSD